MLRLITLMALCQLGLAGCSTLSINNGVEPENPGSVSRLVLLRGFIHTQTQLLDNILTSSLGSGVDPFQTDSPSQRALLTAYCDLVARGAVDGKTYTGCKPFSSVLGQKCSVEYYRRIAQQGIAQDSCHSCLVELQRCLAKTF